jgi:hypothetical protein
MERVVRSAFDPLPRSLSNKGLGLLVAIVLFGTGITVYRYLESSDPDDHRAVPTRNVHASDAHPIGTIEMRSSSSSAPATQPRCGLTATTEEPRPGCATPAERPSTAPGADTSPASWFRPEGESSGS